MYVLYFVIISFKHEMHSIILDHLIVANHNYHIKMNCLAKVEFGLNTYCLKFEQQLSFLVNIQSYTVRFKQISGQYRL